MTKVKAALPSGFDEADINSRSFLLLKALCAYE
jgi:hypothetical protein